MNNYKPYSYLYKSETEPRKLKSCFITQIPAGKKLTLQTGDPSVVNGKTYIRYKIEDDPSKTETRYEEFENEFGWNGSNMDVVVKIGDGEGDEGGETTTSSIFAEIL